MTEGHVAVLSNRGRYALDKADGVDLTSGDCIAVWLGGQWIRGSIESGAKLSTELVPGRPTRGYYFISDDGGVCGLCVGMKVRLL